MSTEASSLSYSPEQVIGEILDIEPAALFDKDGHGTAQLDGARLHLQIHSREDAKVLVLMADLGALPIEKRAESYRWMLIENSGWRDLAGGALCTDESGDHAWLRLRLDLDTLEAGIVSEWIEAFAGAAEAWARRVAAPDSLPEALDGGDTDPRRAMLRQDFLGFVPFNLA